MFRPSVSPIRQRIDDNRSRSPISINSRAIMMAPQQQNIIIPPPGMQTVLKPKYYEAVEVPIGIIGQNINRMQSLPQQSFGPQQVQNQVKQTQDIDQVNRIQQLEKELASSTQRVQFLEQTQRVGQKDIDEYQKQEYIKNQISQELYNQQQRHQDEIQKLQKQMMMEMDDVKQVLTRQCEEYFRQYQQAEKERGDLSMKLYSYDAQMKKMQQMNAELHDQQDKVVLLTKEINIWKGKCNDIENERVRQLEDLRLEYENIYNKQYESLKYNAENKCVQLEDQMQKNQAQLDQAIREAEQWRSRYHQGDLDKLGSVQRINQLEVHTLHQQKEIDRLTLSNISKQQEIESLRQRLNQLEFNHIQSFQPNLEVELKRLRDQMELRNKELDDLRNRNQQLESYCIKTKEIEVEYEILQNKQTQSEKCIEELGKYKPLYEQQILEIEAAKRKLDKLESQFNEEKRNLYRSQQENNRINDLLRIKDDEFNRLNQDYRKNMQQLQNQLNQFREQYDNQLQLVYNNKNKSDNEFRDSMERKFSVMKDELESLRREREQLLGQTYQMQQIKIQLENKLVTLSGEIERLNQVIRTKYEEQQQIKENYRLTNEQLDQASIQIEDLKNEIETWKQRAREINKHGYNQSQKRLNEINPYHNNINNNVNNGHQAHNNSKHYDSQRQSYYQGQE